MSDKERTAKHPDSEDKSNEGGGFRRDSSRKMRLLVQNWWRKSQFVEVDKASYDSCMHTNAYAIYVSTRQPRIPKKFSTTKDAFKISTVDSAGVAGVRGGPAGPLFG